MVFCIESRLALSLLFTKQVTSDIDSASHFILKGGSETIEQNSPGSCSYSSTEVSMSKIQNPNKLQRSRSVVICNLCPTCGRTEGKAELWRG